MCVAIVGTDIALSGVTVKCCRDRQERSTQEPGMTPALPGLGSPVFSSC